MNLCKKKEEIVADGTVTVAAIPTSDATATATSGNDIITNLKTQLIEKTIMSPVTGKLVPLTPNEIGAIEMRLAAEIAKQASSDDNNNNNCNYNKRRI